MTPSQEPLIWPARSDCIEISYNPVFRDREQEVIDAAELWIELPCKKICFATPVERATPDDGMPLLRTIHIAEGDSRTSVWFIQQTGEIDRALVNVDPMLDRDAFRGSLLRGLGRAIGFDTPPMEIDSVLHAQANLSALTENDATAFCAKYGTCGEL